MSKRHLRQDNICQNCGETVEKRYCSSCGQENIETRQSFGHLLRHFVEDLTHYDGAFWLTMKYLLFRPAYLTKEYLSGKRIRFVPPVRLYIFISFVTFLLPFILPDLQSTAHLTENVRPSDSIRAVPPRTINFGWSGDDRLIVRLPKLYSSFRQMDSAQSALPPHKRLNFLDRWFAGKYITMQKYSGEELGDRFSDSFGHSFPKALFLFLPLFAFVLWLFHNKKRSLYFDHAIFTLHYFSFLLLLFNLMTISEVFLFLGANLHYILQMSMLLIIILAIFIYFFIAHKRVYGESKIRSFVKSLFIYGINLFLFVTILICLAFISIFNIH